jgi:effector-binding domain-containing protein
MTVHVATSPDVVSIVQREPQEALVVDIEGPTAEMPRMMADAFGRTAAAVESAGATFAGPPFARYHSFGEVVRAEVGFPFLGRVEPPVGPLRIVELPGGRAVTTTHVGPYDKLGEAWERAQAWMAERKLVASGPPWECYLTDPETPGPPVTEVVMPIR